MKKKIFFLIWANPKFYQTLISLSKHFTKKNYKVYILTQNIKTKFDMLENVDFGKESKIIYHPLYVVCYILSIICFILDIIY